MGFIGPGARSVAERFPVPAKGLSGRPRAIYSAPMQLYVAYFRFKPGTNALQGLSAFERRKTFEHPPQAKVIGEYWVNAPEKDPQVVLVWESEDEGPGDYYDAAWGDIFDITVSIATLPLSEIPESLPEQVQARLASQG